MALVSKSTARLCRRHCPRQALKPFAYSRRGDQVALRRGDRDRPLELPGRLLRTSGEPQTLRQVLARADVREQEVRLLGEPNRVSGQPLCLFEVAVVSEQPRADAPPADLRVEVVL